jgi:hypothetical protein
MSSEVQQGVNLAAGGKIADARGSDEVIRRWVGERQQVSRDFLGQALKVAREHGGRVVSASLAADGDDTPYCGTVTIHFPFPRGGEGIPSLAAISAELLILTHGIPIPDILSVRALNPAGPVEFAGAVGVREQ